MNPAPARTVLVVDDSEAMRGLMENLLHRPGYGPVEVLHAANGAEALALACARHLDLILCDLEMPVMDGLEFLRALRRHNRAAPVLMVAAGDSDDDVVEALLRGAYGCLRKPFTAEQLRQLILPVLAPVN